MLGGEDEGDPAAEDKTNKLLFDCMIMAMKYEISGNKNSSSSSNHNNNKDGSKGDGGRPDDDDDDDPPEPQFQCYVRWTNAKYLLEAKMWLDGVGIMSIGGCMVDNNVVSTRPDRYLAASLS